MAVVGQSGCGKSTIIQLIERFYDVDSGVVKIDGIDVKEFNLTWLRQQLGLVSQEPILFTGSIASNIRLGKPDATDEEVQKAAKAANAHNFILGFPGLKLLNGIEILFNILSFEIESRWISN